MFNILKTMKVDDRNCRIIRQLSNKHIEHLNINDRVSDENILKGVRIQLDAIFI